MGMYSKDPILDAFVEKVYAELLSQRHIVDPESFKEINYGVSFRIGSGKGNAVAIYHSPKKGFSVVTKDEKIRGFILSLLSEGSVMGSDEAGKGDLFGPLVVAAFYLGAESTDILSLGIRDSKEMKDEDVIRIYGEMKRRFSRSFRVVRIMPKRYNSFYSDLRAKGKNLNHMMAWAHGKALSALAELRPEADRAIVDRFSEKPDVLRMISGAVPAVSVDFQVRGERNPAVAAASMAARGVSPLLKNFPRTCSEENWSW